MHCLEQSDFNIVVQAMIRLMLWLCLTHPGPVRSVQKTPPEALQGQARPTAPED
jgi:hypothetical protein